MSRKTKNNGLKDAKTLRKAEVSGESGDNSVWICHRQRALLHYTQLFDPLLKCINVGSVQLQDL